MYIRKFRSKAIFDAYFKLRYPKDPDEDEVTRLENELFDLLPLELKIKLSEFVRLYAHTVENERRYYFQCGWMHAKKETP